MKYWRYLIKYFIFRLKFEMRGWLFAVKVVTPLFVRAIKYKFTKKVPFTTAYVAVVKQSNFDPELEEALLRYLKCS